MVLLTQDLDFGILLAKSSAARPSVVRLRSDDVLPGVIGSRVVEALRQMAPKLAAGALLTIDPSRRLAVMRHAWQSTRGVLTKPLWAYSRSGISIRGSSVYASGNQ